MTSLDPCRGSVPHPRPEPSSPPLLSAPRQPPVVLPDHTSCPESFPGSCHPALTPHPEQPWCLQHPHSINGPVGWGHRAQGPTPLPGVLVAVACPTPRCGLLRRTWGPGWPAGCPQWPPCPVGLRLLAQACGCLLVSPGPLDAPSRPARNSLLGLFWAVSASGPTRPPQLRFSSGRGLSRESAEASEPLAAVPQHARGAGGTDLGSVPPLAGVRPSPLRLLQGRGACPSSPPVHPVLPTPSRSIAFLCHGDTVPPSREPESSGGNRFRWRGWGGGENPPGPGRERVPLGSAAPAGPCGWPGQAFGSGLEGLTSACSCWPWASRRTSCSSPRSRLSSASRRSRACVTGVGRS